MANRLYRKTLRLHPDVVGVLYKLPREAAVAMWEVLRALEVDPHPETSKQVAGHENVFEIMSGRYRIVYEVPEEKDYIRIVRIHMVV